MEIICEQVEMCFEIMYDFAFEMFATENNALQHVFQDERFHTMMKTVIWDRTIQDWMDAPLEEWFQYVLEHIRLPYAFLKKNASSRIKTLLQNITQCKTADALLHRVQKEHFIDSMIPVEKMMKKYGMQSSWVSRDVYYEAFRSFFTISGKVIW